METDANKPNDLTEMTARIVAAYVGNNLVERPDLPALVAAVGDGLRQAGNGAVKPVEAEKPVPAVPIRKSVTDDFIVCLEDGKKFKSLKRHLTTHYDLTPEAYREKWGLPSDYPMVAPAYAAARSALAKASGLGNSRRKADVVEEAPLEPAAVPAKRRGVRKAKAA